MFVLQAALSSAHPLGAHFCSPAGVLKWPGPFATFNHEEGCGSRHTASPASAPSSYSESVLLSAHCGSCAGAMHSLLFIGVSSVMIKSSPFSKAPFSLQSTTVESPSTVHLPVFSQRLEQR